MGSWRGLAVCGFNGPCNESEHPDQNDVDDWNLIPGAQSLADYKHPERAFYIFGPEDGTLGERVLSWCRDVVYVPMEAGCMNLAAIVNVVLYDRASKARKGA